MENRRSIWFSIGSVCLTLAWGPPLIYFLGVLTWGLVFLVVPVLIFGVPYGLLHYLLWGHRFSRQLRQSGVTDPRHCT